MLPFPCCNLAAREAITFHREFGYDFDTSQGKITCAGNLGHLFGTRSSLEGMDATSLHFFVCRGTGSGSRKQYVIGRQMRPPSLFERRRLHCRKNLGEWPLSFLTICHAA